MTPTQLYMKNWYKLNRVSVLVRAKKRYQKNKKRIRLYIEKWQKKNAARVKAASVIYYQKNASRIKAATRARANLIEYGGQRQAVLERDNYSCCNCGMTDKDHRIKFECGITIDHKDGNRSNNLKSNLQTLCLTCHGSKDGKRRKK